MFRDFAPDLRASTLGRLIRPRAVILVLIAIGAFQIRVSEQDFFNENPDYWSVTAFHLANARAISDGKPFHYIPEDRQIANDFLFKEEGSFKKPLEELDRRLDEARENFPDRSYVPYFADQGGWGVMIFLARHFPGISSLSDVCTFQILLDIGALLLLYPIVVFITGRRWVALVVCAIYGTYFPLAYAASEPFRDAWPGFAIIYSMGLLIPVWRRGPGGVLKMMGWVVAAGVVVGLATYVRSTAVNTPITLFIITLILWRKFWPSFAVGTVVVAGLLAVMTPWMIHTHSTSDTVSLVSSGGGHTFLIGLGDESDNPIGLRYDDTAGLAYVRDVCGYDVEYLTFPYSAACFREANRFLSDHSSYYLKLFGIRIWRDYTFKEYVPLMKWGVGKNYVSFKNRERAERWLAPLGMLGMVVGLLVFPHAWIPLAWVFHFWVFIFPFHSHPRQVLGAEWGLLVGFVMLVFGVGILALRVVRRVRGGARLNKNKKRNGGKNAEADLDRESDSSIPGWRVPRFRLITGGALGFNLLILSLLITFRPHAPSPTFDWRAGLGSLDPLTRLETIAKTEIYGHDALPVLTAGLLHEDAAVRLRTLKVIQSYNTPIGVFDFRDGESKIPHINPDAKMRVVSQPEADNGYSLVATTPRGVYSLFALAWPNSITRGLYRVSLRARGTDIFRFVFMNEDGVALKEESGDLRGSNLFRIWDVPYVNHAQADPLILSVEFRSTGSGPPQMVLEIDWIEVWAEAGYQGFELWPDRE